MTKLPRQSRGFTLLEVLVALAVIAIPLLAVMESVTTNVSNAAYLRDRTFAHWVAMNQVTEQQLSPQWPAPGQTEDQVLMSGRTWYWKMTVKVTDDPDRKSTRLNSSHSGESRMPSSA